MGLGHMRRNLLIAETLTDAGLPVSVLLIAGAREASLFSLPPGVDVLTLPALRKEGAGHYVSRSLGLSPAQMHALRAQAIRAAVEAFEPHVLIVDNVPRGAVGELTPTLEMLRARRSARLVLGLRDVLDDPAFVRREWAAAGNEQAIRDFYHAVWVYGDPAVYDLVREYRWAADVAARVHFTGYLDRRRELRTGPDDPAGPAAMSSRPYVLCTVGGGEDGAALARAFAEAVLPAGLRGVILTGPFMDAEIRAELRRRAERRLDFSVVEFLSEPLRLLEGAERVVAMGGYNTVAEVLSYEKPALIAPRVTPRREQWIRAERLAALGLVEVLSPEAATAQAISRWLAAPPARLPVRGRIDLNGLQRLPGLLEALLPASRGERQRPVRRSIDRMARVAG